jgi:hypothetical protein
MNKEHTFYDYIDASGINLIKDWLHGNARLARVRFNFIINQLEASPPPSFKGSVWTRPFVYNLTDDWKGFLEIRAQVNKIEYRLIGQRKGRSILMTTWAHHDGKGWHTESTPGTAKIRIDQMIANMGRYAIEHEI